jgi:hypothetical protein
MTKLFARAMNNYYSNMGVVKDEKKVKRINEKYT